MEEMAKINPYAIIGVSNDADDKEIQKAYRQKSLQCHPDLFPDDEGKTGEFQQLTEAYKLIETAEKRRLFSQKAGASLRRGAEGAHTSFYKRMFRMQE